MGLSRKNTTIGLVTLGLVGGLAGGGVALASAGATPSSEARTTTATSAWCGGTGMMVGTDAPMTAAASYLGITRDELVAQMHSGQSLPGIALAHGKTTAGLRDVMVAAMQRYLTADTALSPAQRAAMLATMRAHLSTMLTSTHVGGMHGMDPDDMGNGAMMGGSTAGMMAGSGSGMMSHH